MKRARKEHVFSIIHDFGENVNLRKRKLEKGLGVFLADFRFRNFPKPIDKARRSCYNRQRSRACSSVGRALRSQRRGRGFESHQVHAKEESETPPFCVDLMGEKTRRASFVRFGDRLSDWPSGVCPNHCTSPEALRFACKPGVRIPEMIRTRRCLRVLLFAWT